MDCGVCAGKTCTSRFAFSFADFMQRLEISTDSLRFLRQMTNDIKMEYSDYMDRNEEKYLTLNLNEIRSKHSLVKM